MPNPNPHSGNGVAPACQWAGRVSLSELGRLLAEQRDGAAQQAIQRTWRFTASERLPIRDAIQGPLLWLLRGRKRWKKRL